MNRVLCITLLGIEFEVSVEYEDKYVCGVDWVKVDGKKLNCDTEQFYKETEEKLHEELEKDLLASRLAYEDMVYETMREERVFDKTDSNK